MMLAANLAATTRSIAALRTATLRAAILILAMLQFFQFVNIVGQAFFHLANSAILILARIALTFASAALVLGRITLTRTALILSIAIIFLLLEVLFDGFLYRFAVRTRLSILPRGLQQLLNE